MGQLKIKRLKEWANRRFKYKIFIDGQELFEIANGQERMLTVDNARTLQAKLMWCGSERVEIPTDKESIKEIRVKSNKGLSVWFPLISCSILIFGGLFILFNPDSDVNRFIAGLISGVTIYALALVTIWRNKFLHVELVTD